MASSRILEMAKVKNFRKLSTLTPEEQELRKEHGRKILNACHDRIQRERVEEWKRVKARLEAEREARAAEARGERKARKKIAYEKNKADRRLHNQALSAQQHTGR